MNEIGKDLVDQYNLSTCNYLLNDASIRYIDNDIETDYSNSQGLSLRKKGWANAIV
jgi:hypothetical protein